MRWRVTHGKQAHGIRAIARNHFKGIDAIVFRFRHLLDTADRDRLAIGEQIGRVNTTFIVVADIKLLAVVINRLAIIVAIERLGNHHALRQQITERLIRHDQTRIAHQFVKKARIE